MLNYGKKIRALRDKKQFLTLMSEKIFFERNKKP